MLEDLLVFSIFFLLISSLKINDEILINKINRPRNIKTVIMPNTPQQMLLRGQNLLGYKHYADDVVFKFVEKAKLNGVDVFRVFDALNDPRNMETALKAVIQNDGHAQGTISYTTSPVHNLQTWIDLSLRLQDFGCHSIAIKDMAGLLDPYIGFELVSKLKEEIDIPLHLHSHATTGMSTTTAIKCIEAGLDNVDTSISSMSMTYGHSATETLVGILQDTKYDTNIRLDSLVSIATHFRKVRKKYAEYEGSLRGVDARIISSQVPGGMLTNLENQLKEQNAIEKFDEVIDEIPNVRADLGFIPLVTPTSQIVGTQAVINILSGKRYKTVTKETAALLKGEYGATPAPVDHDLQSTILDGNKAVTCRPADLLGNNEFDETKESFIKIINDKNLSIEQSEENILTYALFPEVGIKFFENIDNSDFFEKAPLDFSNSEGDIYKVSIEDKNYFVKYSKASDPEILNQNTDIKKNNNDINISSSGEVITAPLSGNIFSIIKRDGDNIQEDDTVIVLEAMKMETTIKTPLNGVIKKVF